MLFLKNILILGKSWLGLEGKIEAGGTKIKHIKYLYIIY